MLPDLLLQASGPPAWFWAYFGIIALVGLVVLVLSIIVTVQAYKAGREGWWVYLICIFVSPLNLAAVIAWFAYLRKNPVKKSDGTPFL